MTTFIQVPTWEYVRTVNQVAAEWKPFLTPYTAGQLSASKCRCYLDRETKSMGYLIAKDGTIEGVFNLNKGNGKGHEIIRSAVNNGGYRLTCFEGLENYYNSLGFYTLEYWTWCDEMAPKDWDYERWGRPRVAVMELTASAQRLHMLGGHYGR